MGVDLNRGISSFREWAIRVAVEQHNLEWAMPVQLESGETAFACTIDAYRYFRVHGNQRLPRAEEIEQVYWIVATHPELKDRIAIYEHGQKKMLLFFVGKGTIEQKAKMGSSMLYLRY